jgi:hypothetical protein
LGCPLAAAQQRQARSDLSGRCLVSFDSPRSQRFFFYLLLTAVQACQGAMQIFLQPRSSAGRAELFFRAAFSFVIRSHLRRNFVLTFCGAWNLCSTLFQNPASEI